MDGSAVDLDGRIDIGNIILLVDDICLDDMTNDAANHLCTQRSG